MKHHTFVDYATQGYLLIVGLLILCFHGTAVPNWPWLLGAHAVSIGAIHALIRFHAAGKGGRLVDFLRSYYPIVFYTGFYRETGELHHMFSPEFLDAGLIRLEERLFGFQPSLSFMEWLPYPVVSEVLYAAYFSYYLMIAGVGLALFLRDRSQFQHYVTVVSLVFYMCYLTYIFLPVMGPRCFYRDPVDFALPLELQPEITPDFPAAVRSGVFFRIMAVIYDHFEAAGAAFPSSHVALAVTTVWFSFRYLRRIRYIHLVDVTLLCLATIYCRYHYAVDVVAGLITAALLVPLGNWLYFKFRDVGQMDDPEAKEPAVAGRQG